VNPELYDTPGDSMITLYQHKKGRITRYHQAWVHDNHVVEHFGTLGYKGTTKKRPLIKWISKEKNLEWVLLRARLTGYKSVEIDKHAILLIEYPINGLGTTADLKKRHALQDRINETLGWTGLGHCDGGSSGSDTMEVCCFVVDFDLAKKVIQHDLRRTKFANYSRIYIEGMD